MRRSACWDLVVDSEWEDELELEWLRAGWWWWSGVRLADVDVDVRIGVRVMSLSWYARLLELGIEGSCAMFVF